MNKTLKMALVIGGAVALGIGGYYLYKKYSKGSEGEEINKVNPETKKSNKIVFTR